MSRGFRQKEPEQKDEKQPQGAARQRSFAQIKRAPSNWIGIIMLAVWSLAGLRDILIHQYFGIDVEIVFLEGVYVRN